MARILLTGSEQGEDKFLLSSKHTILSTTETVHSLDRDYLIISSVNGQPIITGPYDIYQGHYSRSTLKDILCKFKIKTPKFYMGRSSIPTWIHKVFELHDRVALKSDLAARGTGKASINYDQYLKILDITRIDCTTFKDNVLTPKAKKFFRVLNVKNYGEFRNDNEKYRLLEDFMNNDIHVEEIIDIHREFRVHYVQDVDARCLTGYERFGYSLDYNPDKVKDVMINPIEHIPKELLIKIKALGDSTKSITLSFDVYQDKNGEWGVIEFASNYSLDGCSSKLVKTLSSQINDAIDNMYKERFCLVRDHVTMSEIEDFIESAEQVELDYIVTEPGKSSDKAWLDELKETYPKNDTGEDKSYTKLGPNLYVEETSKKHLGLEDGVPWGKVAVSLYKDVIEQNTIQTLSNQQTDSNTVEPVKLTLEEQLNNIIHTAIDMLDSNSKSKVEIDAIDLSKYEFTDIDTYNRLSNGLKHLFTIYSKCSVKISFTITKRLTNRIKFVLTIVNKEPVIDKRMEDIFNAEYIKAFKGVTSIGHEVDPFTSFMFCVDNESIRDFVIYSGNDALSPMITFDFELSITCLNGIDVLEDSIDDLHHKIIENPIVNTSKSQCEVYKTKVNQDDTITIKGEVFTYEIVDEYTRNNLSICRLWNVKVNVLTGDQAEIYFNLYGALNDNYNLSLDNGVVKNHNTSEYKYSILVRLIPFVKGDDKTTHVDMVDWYSVISIKDGLVEIDAREPIENGTMFSFGANLKGIWANNIIVVLGKTDDIKVGDTVTNTGEILLEPIENVKYNSNDNAFDKLLTEDDVLIIPNDIGFRDCVVIGYNQIKINNKEYYFRLPKLFTDHVQLNPKTEFTLNICTHWINSSPYTFLGMSLNSHSLECITVDFNHAQHGCYFVNDDMQEHDGHWVVPIQLYKSDLVRHWYIPNTSHIIESDWLTSSPEEVLKNYILPIKERNKDKQNIMVNALVNASYFMDGNHIHHIQEYLKTYGLKDASIKTLKNFIPPVDVLETLWSMIKDVDIHDQGLYKCLIAMVDNLTLVSDHYNQGEDPYWKDIGSSLMVDKLK